MNPMRIIAIIFLSVNILFLSKCATTRNYLEDRMRDSGDIFHVGLEKDVYGASIFIDSVGLGIQHSANGKGIGMRYGNFGLYKTGGKVIKVRVKTVSTARVRNLCDYNDFTDCLDKLSDYTIIVTRYGNSTIEFNTSFHKPAQLTNRNFSKQVSLFSMFLLIFFGGSKSSWFLYDTDPKEDNRGNYTILPIEISAGLYLGIRLGFNFSELADFLVGFVGFDPLGDDIAGIPQPIILDKNWENQMDNLDKDIDEINRPIPMIEKSKYFKAKWDDMHHCNRDNVCYNYQRQEFKANDLENECKRDGGLFAKYSKCQQKNIIGFCQFSDFEKVYNYYHSIWNIQSAENDCKLLKGKFVK
jgi:hypothetical protein